MDEQEINIHSEEKKRLDKKKLIWILIGVVLVLAVILRIFLANPPQAITQKPVSERERPEASATPDTTRTADAIYLHAQQTLTAMPEHDLSSTQDAGDETITSPLDLTAEAEEDLLFPTITPGTVETKTTLQATDEFPGGLHPNPSPTPGSIFLPSPTTDTRAETGIIPGLTPDEAVSYLETGDFDCSDGKIDPFGIFFWNCEHTSTDPYIPLTIYGRSETTVDLIDTWISSTDIDLNASSISILSYIATIPYTNADPESAANWVQSNLPGLASSLSLMV
ncbi:MAG: hypothetical protein MUO76_18360, partial [Anaerolineaceae bacterium]|nr:hypothetical protein [Anaerolineaceae bacterium]